MFFQGLEKCLVYNESTINICWVKEWKVNERLVDIELEEANI